MPELLTVKEVCALLKLSRTRLYKRIEEGAIPRPFHVANRCPRWRREVLERWIAEREAAA